MSGQKILLIASYAMGDEFEQKVAKIETLKKQGFDINIGHLVNLQDYGRGLELPYESIAKMQIEHNLKYAIEKYRPTIIAFHSGMAFKKFWESVKFYIWDIGIRHQHIKILIEGYDKDELPFLKYEGLEKMEKVIEKQNELYDILWN